MSGGPVLYVIGCAAPPVLEIGELLAAARVQGWDPCLVLSPTAARWLGSELPRLTGQIGRPVRSEYTLPGDSTGLPGPDALLIAPATANTINKWAAGISDNLVLGLANQGIAKGWPTVVLPCLSGDQAHPAFPRSVATLRGAGVCVLLPPPPVLGGAGPGCAGSQGVGLAGPRSEGFAWGDGLDALAVAWRARGAGSPVRPS